MSVALATCLRQLNHWRRASYAALLFLRLLRATLLAGTVLGVWSYIRPEQEWTQVILTLLTFIIGMAFNSKRHSRPVSEAELLMTLEIKNPGTASPAFALRNEDPPPEVVAEWTPLLQAELSEFLRFEGKRLLGVLSTLPIPLLCFALATGSTSNAIRTALSNVSKVVAQLSRGATLRVIDGSPGDAKFDMLTLSSSRTTELELLAENMIEIKVVSGFGERAPTVNLKKRIPGQPSSQENPIFQSFQLSPVRGADVDKSTGVYSLAFAVTDDVEVYLSNLSEQTPAAIIKVRQLPVPKVRLEITADRKDPWPDDKPLPLRIDVTADNPLELVRLNIKSSGRVHTELVTNILATDKTELSTNYNLLLESYVQSDLAEVEVVAEAVDRSLPLPLVGQSPPLVIRTASAYGRYRQTLQTLREAKAVADDLISRGVEDKELLGKIRENTAKAFEQSEESPFFDGLDRVHLNRFMVEGAGLEQSFAEANLIEFSQGINEFLFDHEILDDKERDRDFFVAARSLSRLIETKREKRSVAVAAVTQRIKSFIDDRHRRWELRVKRLGPDSQPKSWERIQTKPFNRAMDRIAYLDSQEDEKSNANALMELSKTVSAYREWIEELEALEEKARREEEQKRQQGLTNSRNIIKEMQKRQGDISAKLDKAADRPQEQLDEAWPSTRMDQNTNIGDAKSLEAQLRALSPLAGERVKAAAQAMDLTVDSGNKQAYAQAESGSDLAGRLLRQAQSEAAKSQRQQRSRGRRRRVTGDNYFGSQVAGGDVEIRREYEVNRRYREDILDDVRSHSGREEGDETLLENYLRKVIR